jgi:hypothetical protein
MFRAWNRNWTGCVVAGGVAVMMGVLLAGRASAQQPPLPPSVTAPAAPMDEPLQILAAAKASYANVKDYSCLFIKQERINGRLQEQNVMSMKVRVRPFSVYLLWLMPRDMKGQEASYIAGRNNGQMRIHATGLLRGAVGFVSIDVNDPRVQASSRHSITEAGIGNLLDVFSRRWQQEKAWGQTQVRIANYDYAKRHCTRVEMTHPFDTHYQFYRSVVYFDKETKLPIRVENYDWPQKGGVAGGNLVESYSYVQMRFNAGLPDAVFNH